MGNLLTIVLVSLFINFFINYPSIYLSGSIKVVISDSIFGHGLETLTLPSVLGASAIVAAFAVLVAEERNAEMERQKLRPPQLVGQSTTPAR